MTQLMIGSRAIRRLIAVFIAGSMVSLGILDIVRAQEPAAAGGAVPADGQPLDSEQIMKTYVINPLDRLMIVVYAGDKQIQEFRDKFVQSDGTVYLPFIEEDVEIGGLMVLDAQKKLEELARKYIKEPRVVITVMSSYSQSVSTYGRISNRTFDLNTPTRILQLIARAGGPTENALEDSIRIISKDGSIRYFNYAKVNKNPSNEENFMVRPGDIIYVPGIEDLSVIVFGEVRSSGIYNMKRGTKLLDAMVKAGSWTGMADIENVRILRTQGKRTIPPLEVNLKDIFDKGRAQLNYTLQDGDMVFVPSTRSTVALQYWSTMFTIIQTVVTTLTLYQALQR